MHNPLEILMATDNELTRLAPLIIIIVLMGASKLIQALTKKFGATGAKQDSSSAPDETRTSPSDRPPTPPQWIREMLGLEEEFEPPDQELVESSELQVIPRAAPKRTRQTPVPREESQDRAPARLVKDRPSVSVSPLSPWQALVTPDLQNVRGAQKAFIYHEIFSPPKGLRDEPESWEL